MSVCTAILEYMKLSRFQVQDKAETLSNKKICLPVQTLPHKLDKYNTFLFFIQTANRHPSSPLIQIDKTIERFGYDVWI